LNTDRPVLELAVVDWLIVGALVLWAIGNGLRHRRAASSSLTSYFLADRSLRGWQAGLSLAATQFAADTPLVFTGLVATAGVFHLWQFWSYGVSFLLIGFLFAPAWRRAAVVTGAEWVSLRYPGSRGTFPLRVIRAVVFGTMMNAVVLAMVLFATTLLIERLVDFQTLLPAAVFDPLVGAVRTVGVPLTPLPPGTPVDLEAWARSASNLVGLVLLGLFTLAYATTGGLRSVVATDVVQLALMLTGTAAYAWLAWNEASAGGASPVDQLLGPAGPGGDVAGGLLSLDPGQASGVTGGLVTVFAIQWLIQRNADGSGYLAQRVMACRTDEDARQAMLVFTVVQVVVRSLFWVALAVALLVLFPIADPGEPATVTREATYLDGLGRVLPVGLRGVLVAGFLAALASTLDTHLNWGASYWANDLYGEGLCRRLLRREPADPELVRVARLANATLLVLALAVMSALGSIQEAWKISLVMGAGIGPVLVLRWVWWRVTAWAELWALVASLAGSVLALAFLDGEAARMLGVAALASGVAVGVSLWGPPPSAPALATFFERARPPGFWAPVARGAAAAQAARRELGRGLVLTALWSFGVFAVLLVGLTWLLGPAAW